MHKAMLEWGFKCLHTDPCVYYRVSALGTVLSVVHVDDFLIVSGSPDASHAFKEELKALWSISDLGECSKDMGSYPSLISFTFHYLAFVSHDSLPYLSVVVM